MKINSTTTWLLSPWWLQWLVPMGSIWFWEPHLGDRFLTICSVWQVCSAEGVNLRTDLKYLYSSRAMYLLQSCITFCTVYNKGSCFLFLPDCLGSCFACAVGCCLGWEEPLDVFVGSVVVQGTAHHLGPGAGTKSPGLLSPQSPCPLPSSGFVAPGSGYCHGFHKATSHERIHLEWGWLLPSRCNLILLLPQGFSESSTPLETQAPAIRAKAGVDLSGTPLHKLLAVVPPLSLFLV